MSYNKIKAKKNYEIGKIQKIYEKNNKRLKIRQIWYQLFQRIDSGILNMLMIVNDLDSDAAFLKKSSIYEYIYI